MVEPFRAILLPAPPRAQAEWTLDYANQMNRWLTLLQENTGGIVFLRGSGMYLALESLPITGYGLRPGEVFANEGVLTVVREGDIWAGSFPVSAAVGSVTVTVT